MTALRGLSEVFGQGGYSNLVLERLMRNNELSGQERAFCTALFSDTRTSRTSPFTFDTISTLSPERMVPLSVYQSVTAPRLTRVLSTFRQLPMSSW